MGKFCKVFDMPKGEQLLMKHSETDADENNLRWPALEFWTEYKGRPWVYVHSCKSEELSGQLDKSWSIQQSIFDSMTRKEAKRIMKDIIADAEKQLKKMNEIAARQQNIADGVGLHGKHIQ